MYRKGIATRFTASLGFGDNECQILTAQSIEEYTLRETEPLWNYQIYCIVSQEAYSVRRLQGYMGV